MTRRRRPRSHPGGLSIAREPFRCQRCRLSIGVGSSVFRKFDFGSYVPLYMQAADWIAAEVEAGRLKRGTKLRAERELAEPWGAGYMTIRRAMKEPRERDPPVVASQMGKGTFIR